MLKLTVLIPCYNEEKGVGKVIENIPHKELNKLGYSVEVLVVDNNSTDKTSQVARDAGARVVFEQKQGKAYALKAGFAAAKGDVIITIDGDNTYPANEIVKIMAHFYGSDLIIGSRFDSLLNLTKITKPKGLAFHRSMANKIGAVIASILLIEKITDVTTGLRAFKKELLIGIPEIKAKGLDFEAEFTSIIIARGFIYREVKITTNSREGQSSLNFVIDSFRFLFAIIRGMGFVRKKLDMKHVSVRNWIPYENSDY